MYDEYVDGITSAVIREFGLRIEREEFPGKYYYGWVRVEVSSDGKIARFIDFYSHRTAKIIFYFLHDK